MAFKDGITKPKVPAKKKKKNIKSRNLLLPPPLAAPVATSIPDQPILAIRQCTLIKKPSPKELKKLEEFEEVEQDQNFDQQPFQTLNPAITAFQPVTNGKKKELVEEKKVQNKQANGHYKDLSASRICFNRKCGSKKIFKKIRSKVDEHKYRFFCEICYQLYSNNRFCEFCQQIHANELENEDDEKWISCDFCQRQNHVACQKVKRQRNIVQLKDKQELYSCLACSQKKKAKSRPQRHRKEHAKYERPEPKNSGKQSFSVSSDKKIPIFHLKHLQFPQFQKLVKEAGKDFPNQGRNSGYRLCLTQSQIQQDLKKIRALCTKDTPTVQKTVQKHCRQSRK